MIVSSFLELALQTESAKKVFEIAMAVGAFLKGEFTLHSGQKSDHYFDGKKVTLWPEGVYWVGKAVLEALGGSHVDAVGGLSIGADPIATAVALVSWQQGEPIPAFIVREEKKQHGTYVKVAGYLRAGFKVAIVDDVITTGDSVYKAIEAVKAANCEVVKVVALVDRHEGGSDKLRREGYDFASILHLWPSGEVTIGESSTVAGDAEAGILRT